MKSKCYLVALKELVSISEKCYKATDFNGNTDLIPKSQVYGYHTSMKSTESVYISAWILAQKKLTYSMKEYWFDSDTDKIELSIQEKNKKRKKDRKREGTDVYVPPVIEPIKVEIPEELLK